MIWWILGYVLVPVVAIFLSGVFVGYVLIVKKRCDIDTAIEACCRITMGFEYVYNPTQRWFGYCIVLAWPYYLVHHLLHFKKIREYALLIIEAAYNQVTAQEKKNEI